MRATWSRRADGFMSAFVSASGQHAAAIALCIAIAPSGWPPPRRQASPAPDKIHLAINRSHMINSHHAKQCGWHKSRLKYAPVPSRRSSTVTAHQSQHQGYLRAAARPCSAHWQGLRRVLCPTLLRGGAWPLPVLAKGRRGIRFLQIRNVAQSPISKSGFARSSKQKCQQVGVSEPKM